MRYRGNELNAGEFDVPQADHAPSHNTTPLIRRIEPSGQGRQRAEPGRLLMSQEIDVLLSRVDDPVLRSDLKRQIDQLRSKQQFGLVFENHLPETVRLPSHPVRRGLIVTKRDADEDRTWTVQKVARRKATIIREDEHPTVAPVDDLVVVAEFGDPIYPGLKPIGSVDRGGDRPAHVVIEGENHHALEALQFTHAGKVDCIYIDPPYNTGGARDWKYNNDYVDKDDGYRHSKWLAFMERRLKLAKQLLNPDGEDVPGLVEVRWRSPA